MSNLAISSPDEAFKSAKKVASNAGQFLYEQSKWAEVKQKSAKDMAEHFAKAGKVLVLNDAKLSREPLAIIRKSDLEKLTNVIQSLADGSAVVSHELETISQAVTVVIRSFEDLAKTHHELMNSTLSAAVKVLGTISVKVNSYIVSSATPKKLKPLPVDKELLNELPDDDTN